MTSKNRAQNPESHKAELDPRSQADKFRDLARELGCDEDEAKFDEALKRIANTPPQHCEKPTARHEPKRDDH